MMKKRVIALLLSMVLVVAMVGCGSDKGKTTSASKDTTNKTEKKSENSSKSEDSKEEVTLNFWTWYPDASEYEPLLDEFTNETGIKVNLLVMGSNDYQKKLPLALSSGETLDVVGMQPNMYSQLSNFLEPLAPMLDKDIPNWKENYDEKSLEQLSHLDKDLRMLNAGSAGDMIIIYNADLVKELGLTIPKTFDEWLTFNNTIREKRPDVIPFGFWGGVEHVYWQVATMFSGQDSQYYNEIAYEDKPWNGEGYVKGIDHLLKMFTTGIINYDEVGDLTRPSVLESFAQGKVAAYMDGSWGSTMLSEKYRKENGYTMDVGAFAFPVAEEGGKPTVKAYLNNCVSMVNTSEHKEEALKLIEFLALGKGSTELANKLYWFTPVKDYKIDESVFTTEASKQGIKTVNELIRNANIDRKNPNVFPENSGLIIVGNILDNNLDAQDIADKLEEEWNTGMYEH